MGGPVQGRWCYSIERTLKVVRKKCRNKCKIEASIAEASILEEVSNFTTTYYGDNLPSVHNPPPRYNAGENESNLSLFRGQLGSASGKTLKTLSHEEWHTIMLYVLTNLEEWSRTWGKSLFSTNLFSTSHYSASNPLVSRRYREFTHEFWHRSRAPTPREFHTLLKWGAGNGKPNFIS